MGFVSKRVTSGESHNEIDVLEYKNSNEYIPSFRPN